MAATDVIDVTAIVAEHVRIALERLDAGGTKIPEVASALLEERWDDMPEEVRRHYARRGLMQDIYDAIERDRGAVESVPEDETCSGRAPARSGRWTLNRLAGVRYTDVDGFVASVLDFGADDLRALAERLRAQARGKLEQAEVAEKLAALVEEYGVSRVRDLPRSVLREVW